jgi:O-antigen/teichoic acid export membrane protein
MRKPINLMYETILLELPLLKDSGILFIAGIMGSLALMFSNIFLSRFLGVEGFGNFKTVTNLFSSFPILFSFGIGGTLIKIISDRRTGFSYIIKKYLLGYAILFVIFGFILFISNNILAFYFLGDINLNYLMIAGLVLFLCTFFDIFKETTVGLKEFKIFSFSEFLRNICFALFSILSAYYFGLFAAIISIGLAYIVKSIPTIYMLFKSGILHIDNRPYNLRKLFFGYSLSMYVISLIQSSAVFIIPILSLFFTQTYVGYFGFALIFFSGSVMFANALETIMFPEISELSKICMDRAWKKFTNVLTIYIPIACACFIFAMMTVRPFVSYISPKFIPCLPVAYALIFYGLFGSVISFLKIFYMATGQMRKSIYCSVAYNSILFIISIGALMYIM